jgi:cytochrome c5
LEVFSVKKLLLTAAVAVFAMAAQAEPNMEKYGKSCAVCHAAGVAGAPKVGDAAAWEPRLAKGMDALMASVKNGLNAMPPMGMCFDCTDEEYMELIKYMSTPAE